MIHLVNMKDKKVKKHEWASSIGIKTTICNRCSIESNNDNLTDDCDSLTNIKHKEIQDTLRILIERMTADGLSGITSKELKHKLIGKKR